MAARWPPKADEEEEEEVEKGRRGLLLAEKECPRDSAGLGSRREVVPGGTNAPTNTTRPRATASDLLLPVGVVVVAEKAKVKAPARAAAPRELDRLRPVLSSHLANST